MESRKALIDYVIGNEFISKPELQHKFINLLNKHEKSLQLQQTNVSEEDLLEHLNHLIMMPSSELDKFTDDEEMVTMKWFKQFKKK